MKLPGDRNFEVSYDFDGPRVEHRRAEFEKPGELFDDLIPEKRLPLLEEARRRGLLTPEQKAELDKSRHQTAPKKIRAMICSASSSGQLGTCSLHRQRNACPFA